MTQTRKNASLPSDVTGDDTLKKIQVYRYGGIVQRADSDRLRTAKPISSQSCVKVLEPNRRFPTRSGAEVFAYKKSPNGDYLFYAYEP